MFRTCERRIIMLIPRYYFAHTYDDLLPVLLECPHTEQHFKKGDVILHYGDPLTTIYFYRSGIVKASITHEQGYEKTISFHGEGTIFPGCHTIDFQIELSLCVTVIADTDVYSFPRKDFMEHLRRHINLLERMHDWYASYINLLLFESAHQTYNSSFIKLCNILYLFMTSGPGQDTCTIPLTQEELAGILAIERANVSRFLSKLKKENIIVSRRGSLQVIDPDGLLAYCSLETRPGNIN